MRLFDHGGRERHLASLLQVVELRGIGVNGILRPVEIQPGPLRRSHQVDELEGIVPGFVSSASLRRLSTE